MPYPTIAFGILLSLACGGLYHFFRGGTSNKLALYLVLSLAGFWLGDALAWYMDWSFVQVGLLNAGIGAICSFLLMIIGDVLSHIRVGNKESS